MIFIILLALFLAGCLMGVGVLVGWLAGHHR